MANALANLFTDIADSIRSKTGSTEKLSPSEFASQIDSISVGGGGIPTGYHSVTFMNGDNVLFERLVLSGDDCPDPITQGRIETPTKESTVQYNYTYKGWSEALTNITEDKVIYATYTETVRTYTVTFYDTDGTTVLNTQQVAYGGSSTYTYKKDGYMFVGWTPEPTNITSDLECIGAWQESYAFADAPWDYIAQISKSGQASEVFALGDTRTETLTWEDGTTEDVELMIASFDLHPDSDDKPTITLINKQLLSKTSAYTSYSSSKLGSTISYGHTYNDKLKPFMDNTVVTAFSTDLQNVLREGFCEAAFMMSPAVYRKIAPLTYENVGLDYEGNGVVSNETLYSFNASNDSRKRNAPEGSSVTNYWLYNYCGGADVSSYNGGGSIILNTGAYFEQQARWEEGIMFKIFV